MKEKLQEAVRRRPLLGDGAMGTQLMLAGLEQGNCGEAWNLTHPERSCRIPGAPSATSDSPLAAARIPVSRSWIDESLTR